MADTAGMIQFEECQLRDNPEFARLLLEYERQAESAASEPTTEGSDNDGWIRRLTYCDGVPDALLSRAHGRLIAFGLLDFELSSISGGLRYRVTRPGRQFLRRVEHGDAIGELSGRDD